MHLNETVQEMTGRLDEYAKALPDGDTQNSRYNAVRAFADLAKIVGLWKSDPVPDYNYGEQR